MAEIAKMSGVDEHTSDSEELADLKVGRPWGGGRTLFLVQQVP